MIKRENKEVLVLNCRELRNGTDRSQKYLEVLLSVEDEWKRETKSALEHARSSSVDFQMSGF